MSVRGCHICEGRRRDSNEREFLPEEEMFNTSGIRHNACNYVCFCPDCAFKLAVALIAWLRQHGRDVAVIEFARETAGGQRSRFSVFDDDGRAKVLVSEMFQGYDELNQYCAECLHKILTGIREILKPHELKTVEAEIEKTKQKLAELEEKRNLIENETQSKKA